MGGASFTWRQHDSQGHKPVMSFDQRKNLLNDIPPGKNNCEFNLVLFHTKIIILQVKPLNGTEYVLINNSIITF